jgi:hypothetical protein
MRHLEDCIGILGEVYIKKKSDSAQAQIERFGLVMQTMYFYGNPIITGFTFAFAPFGGEIIRCGVSDPVFTLRKDGRGPRGY